MIYLCVTGPSELAAPGYSWRSATFAAVTYTLAVHGFGLYSSREGLALMTLFFVAHTVLGEILERDLDFTKPIAQRLYSWLNIPEVGTAAPNSEKVLKKAE